MSDAGADGISASAKKRAAKKARDEAHAQAQAAAAPPPPAPAAKGKAKAKAEPAPAPPAPPAAEPKAKAKGKAKAAPAPEPPAPEPKAKAKGKAKAAPAPEPAPAPPAPEPKAKAKGKAKAEPKAEPKPEPAAAPAPKAQGKQKAKAGKPGKQEEEDVEAPKPQKEELINYFLDDGTGTGSWEESSGLSKKAEKRKQKTEEQAALPRGASGRPIVQQHVVGMAPQGPQSGQKGASQSVAADVKRILAMKGEGAAVAEQKAAEPVANQSTVSVTVPEKRIGVVIGPKGANIKLLQEKCGVTRIDTSGEIFTITGEPNAVAKAEAAIKDLVEKGYTSIMYEGFSENMVSVHPSYYPDLIGKEGCIVRKLKDALKVEVNFQDIGKGAPAGKKAKVTLAGSAENVEKAKNVISNIMMYGHDELTHPGQFHEEIDIEEWQYRYIIGKGGSEMKHIQHNWKVKVIIPREHSENKKVLVVGERDVVERAKTYIEKVIWNAEDAAKGRDRQDKVEDPWGPEEEEEPWMKQYMYKR